MNMETDKIMDDTNNVSQVSRVMHMASAVSRQLCTLLCQIGTRDICNNNHICASQLYDSLRPRNRVHKHTRTRTVANIIETLALAAYVESTIDSGARTRKRVAPRRVLLSIHLLVCARLTMRRATHRITHTLACSRTLHAVKVPSHIRHSAVSYRIVYIL